MHTGGPPSRNGFREATTTSPDSCGSRQSSTAMIAVHNDGIKTYIKSSAAKEDTSNARNITGESGQQRAEGQQG